MEATIRYYTNRCKASIIGDIYKARRRREREGEREIISSYDLS